MKTLSNRAWATDVSDIQFSLPAMGHNATYNVCHIVIPLVFLLNHEYH